MIRRAVIYSRTAQVCHGSSPLTAQLASCRAYAEKRGYTVIAEFVDNGVSGNLPMDSRPQGREMLDVLKRGSVEAVIVRTADRLSRDLFHFQSLVQHWKQAGIELHYVRGL